MGCTECGRDAPRLRRDRCDACYMRLYRNGAVPAGSVCVVCGERRRALLTAAKLGAPVIVCGNCSLVLEKTRPRIATVADLRRRAARERRAGPDRRSARRGGRRGADQLAARVVAPAFDPSTD